MSKCTAAQALEAFRYWLGYYEKASASYAGTRDKTAFEKNKGSANYTYAGKLCGCNPGAWCAMQVSTAIYEACGGDRSAAKAVMWGRWPHYNCGTVFDDALARGRAHYSWYGRHHKGKPGGDYTPAPGDVIVFTDAWKTRDHTGMVYAVDSTYVYTYEGNSSNQARKRSYPLTSAYIYGYARPETESPARETEAGGIAGFQRWLGVADDGVYGPVTRRAAILAHQRAVNRRLGAGIDEDGSWGPETYYATGSLQQGDEGDDVTVWQGVLYCRGFDPVGLDGDFGSNTRLATEKLQKALGLNASGVADAYTWARAFDCARPAHTLLRRGSSGQEVRYLQRLLSRNGYDLELDGAFGPVTELAVMQYQKERGLEADGIAGPRTWAAIE